jgi:hypothetical protein
MMRWDLVQVGTKLRGRAGVELLIIPDGSADGTLWL